MITEYRVDGPAAAPALVLYNWAPHLATFTSHFKVVRCEPAPSGVEIEALGHDIVGLLDELAIERTSFVGVELGAVVGLWLAAHVPDRIARLVLIGMGESNHAERLASFVVPTLVLPSPGDSAAVLDHLLGPAAERGMAVRRAVLGDAYVDQATAATTPFTADFQDFISRYAWGEIWSRPGLDRRTRSAITVAMLVALGRFDELPLHLRGARTNGLTEDEIGEILLQSAVYCGVPAANTAFATALREASRWRAES